MWWKLGALGLAALALVALLMAPVSTVEITVEMPAGVDASSQQVGETIEFATNLLSFVFVAGSFFLIGWLMWRVVSHHRGLKNHPPNARQ